MSKFKSLPRFDPMHVDYAEQHNATSEAVLQLQGLVLALIREVNALKDDAAGPKGTPPKAPTAKKTAGS